MLFKVPEGLTAATMCVEAVDCNMLRPAGDDQYLCDEKIAWSPAPLRGDAHGILEESISNIGKKLPKSDLEDSTKTKSKGA